MKLFSTMDISGSALTAQRLRMDVISSNIANAETTRGQYVNGQWQPYTRKMVVMEPTTQGSFKEILSQYFNPSSVSEGVRVSGIVDDPTPFKRVYQPNHPDADQNGFVSMPNVDILKEMVDMISASRSYEANVTAINSTKTMLIRALDIGK
ncbi:flagellar basal body rod protein FlgC [Tepidibacillus marianensis]|uniref:flagellar basal body rod protein FlgC n=1 Tax=Tepidibacillus marianensis TaxID=3131995 RepID=UPI0030CF1AF4